MTSVFLSYARADDEPFVRRLCGDLSAAGFTVWFDRHDLRSRGLTFHHEIRDAIKNCDRLVLIVGPKAVASVYVRQEWQFAWFDAEKVVTPILRLNDKTPDGQTIDGYKIIPDELKLLHCEDLRDDGEYQVHMQNLIASLQAPAPPLGQLIGVPSLPAHFLTRTDRLIPLRDAVRSGLDSPAPLGGTATHQKFHGIASTARHVGMHGMGGIGKSVLANLLVHDRKVREAFPDGLVWVGLGSVPNLADLMRRLQQGLGGDGAFADEYEGKTKLQELLADKAVLLILDDVWRKSDADAFDVLGPRCRALITTRDAGLLTNLGGTHHLVELLTNNEALRLLAVSIGKEVHELPAEARAVLKECGRLPLAVSLAGGMVQAGMTWDDLLDALRSHELEFLSDKDRPEQHQDLWKMIEVSVKALPESDQLRLVELAFFPEDAAVPDAAVATLWESTGGLSARHVRKLLVELKQRSLVQIISPAAEPTATVGNVATHDLIHDYCIRRAAAMFGNVSALHEKLLAAYRAKCRDGWSSGPNDGYFFQHLREHLAAAGHTTEAFQLLTDFDWLGAKTRAGLAFDLTRDVLEVHRDMARAQRSVFLPWYYFVRQNAPFLAEHPECFFQQAYNEPVGSPVSQAAQQRWSTSSGKNQPPDSTATLPSAFLDWINRPPHWERPACLMTLQGHTDVVTSVALSADGRTMVSGSDDHTLKVWDAESGACHQTLHGHTRRVKCVALSPDGRTMVSGSDDKTLKVWDAESGACRKTLQGHTREVASVALSSDGRTIVSGSWDDTLKVWDAESGACRQTLRGHTSVVASVALSSDGRTIISGSWDDTLKVWDAESGACRLTLRGHTGCVSSVALSSDGRMIVSGSDDQTLKVWDGESGACRQTLQGHTSGVESVALFSDGRTIVSGSSDHTLKVWDAESGACRQTLQGHTSAVTSLALSSDGRTIVSGSWDHTLKVWDAESGACRQTLQGHTSSVESLAVSANGRTIVSVSSRILKVWDAESRACRQTLQGHSDRIKSIALSADGRTIVSGSLDTTLKVWDAESGACLMTLQGHTGGVSTVALSADGRTIVSGSSDHTLKVWDAESGACRHMQQGHTSWVSTVALSADGRTIVSGSLDTTLKIWDAESGACRHTLRGHTGCVSSVALSSNVRTVVSGSDDNRLKVWDAESGACRQTLEGHIHEVTSVALSADGRTIVSGSDDKTLKVWDAESGACRATYSRDSAEAKAAWRSLGRLDESRRLSTEGGPLQFPLALLPQARRTGAVLERLIAPGNFDQSYGPLTGDTILAFIANGEAHWFRLRCRE